MSKHSKMKTCNLYGESLDWIIGELLGDGCIIITQGTQSQTATFKYSSKYLEYIQYVSNTLRRFGIVRAGEIYKEYNKKWGVWGYHYQSCSYYELKVLYDWWYSGGTKDVSRSTLLTPLVCRQWYIGDGSLHRVNNCIRISTECFPEGTVNWLVKQLINIGIRAKRTRVNRIYISPYSTANFLDYIGECPVECYKYKWNILHRKGETYDNTTKVGGKLDKALP